MAAVTQVRYRHSDGRREPRTGNLGAVQAGQHLAGSGLNSHVSIGKTVLDLLGLPPLGVPRLDDAPSLADLVNTSLSNPLPPAFATTISQPAPPSPAPAPAPVPPSPGGGSVAVGPVLLRDGSTLPPPNDQPVHL